MTIRELAEKINVSPATISIVINGKPGVSEKTRQEVRQAIEQYGYSVKLRTKVSHSSVLLLKFWKSSILVEENQGFISMIIDAIEERLREEHYGMSMMVSKIDLDKTIRSIDYNKYVGMIIVGTEITREMYGLLQEIPIPFVVVDNTVPGYSYNSVCINNEANVHMALRYVKECGHTEIGYFRSSVESENLNIRNDAFLRYTREMGLKFSMEDEILLTPTLVGSYNDLKEILIERTRPLPRCFFADNDTVALGAIKAMKESGYKIPRDISVIGFDDTPFSSIESPALTTIHVQRTLIGRQTVVQLLQLISDPAYSALKSTVIGKLVVRSSVLDLSKTAAASSERKDY